MPFAGFLRIVAAAPVIACHLFDSIIFFPGREARVRIGRQICYSLVSRWVVVPCLFGPFVGFPKFHAAFIGPGSPAFPRISSEICEALTAVILHVGLETRIKRRDNGVLFDHGRLRGFR